MYCNMAKLLDLQLQEGPAVARKDTLYTAYTVPVAIRPLMSFKITGFHVIWNPMCDFLLVIKCNVSPMSYRFRDMASFPLRNFLSPPFNPKFKNVSFACYSTNFVRRESQQRANYSYKKISLKTYLLATIHPLQTDGGQTDDNCAIDAP